VKELNFSLNLYHNIQDLSISRKFVWNALKNCTKETPGEYATGYFVSSRGFEVRIGDIATKWFAKFSHINQFKKFIFLQRILHFYPNGNTEANSSHLSVFLRRKDSLELCYKMELKFWVVSKTTRIGEKFFVRSISEFKDSWGFSKFISHQNFKQHFTEIVDGGNLIFAFEVHVP
jgi:hypothetical protein